MHYTELIHNLINELSYRVGIPNLKDKIHQSIISEILSEWGEYTAKETILEFLTNEDDNAKAFLDGYTHIGAGSYVKDGDVDSEGKAKEGSQKYKSDGKSLTPMSDDEYAKIKGNQGEKGKEAAADSDQNQQGDASTPSDEEKTKKNNVKKLFNTPTQKIKKKKEAKIQDKINGEDDTTSSNSDELEKTPAFDENKVSPQVGKVSDVDDEFSDGKIKQLALEYGTKNKEKFTPAPGNAGSMLGEIMSGEGFAHLDENPNLTSDELAKKMYDQVENTTLGKQNGGEAKPNKSGNYKGLKKDLYNKCESFAKASLTKYKENQRGIENLVSGNKMTKPVKVRNFYGHETSIAQQVNLINKCNGPIYTKEGIEVPREVIIDLIEKSGGGDNPSDTSTITVDSNGKVMVTFHSDKISTSDIQANSTPNKEAEVAIEIIEKTDLPDIIKEDVKRTIEDGNRKLQEKEKELKAAANEPALQMAKGDISKILDGAKKDVDRDGNPHKDKTSTKIKSSLTAYGKPHSNIVKYLPEQDEPHTEEQKFKAYLEYMGDDDKETEPTGDQVTLLFRVGAQQGYDISKDLSRIRMESLETQRETHKKLNEKNHTLPSGKIIPVGDFIEGQNLIEKLHLNVMDGEKNEKGVGKYPGLFNLNMGGILVEAEELKNCIGVDGTDDFIESFEVGTPGDGDTETKNPATGAITGRNIFVFAITKDKKRIPIAYKTQRSKAGQSGKLNTTYQWDNGIQDCFEKQNEVT